MVIHKHTTRPAARKAWLQVDTKGGLALSIVAGVIFALSITGWVVLFAELAQTRNRLDHLGVERAAKTEAMRSTISSLKQRLDTLSSHVGHDGRDLQNDVDPRSLDRLRERELGGTLDRDLWSLRGRLQD